MGEIIKIGDDPKERKSDGFPRGALEAWVWTCAACGNSTFQLIQGGAIRCANCNLHCVFLAHFEPGGKA